MIDMSRPRHQQNVGDCHFCGFRSVLVECVVDSVRGNETYHKKFYICILCSKFPHINACLRAVMDPAIYQVDPVTAVAATFYAVNVVKETMRVRFKDLRVLISEKDGGPDA